MNRFMLVFYDVALWLTVLALLLFLCLGCSPREYAGRVQDKGYSHECQTIAHKWGLDTHCRVIKRERQERW